MKKLFFATALIILSAATYAQSLQFGLKGAFNSTWVFNQDREYVYDYDKTFSSGMGITASYLFNETMSINTEVLFSGHNQNYVPKTETTKPNLKLSYTDIPVLFKLSAEETGGYFEIGPQFSFLSKAEFDNGSTTTDVTEDMASTNVSGILGFGAQIKTSDVLFINAGIRLGYGFSNINGPDAPSTAKPTYTAFGGLHVGLAYRLEL